MDPEKSDKRVMKIIGDLPVFRPSPVELSQHLRKVFLGSPEGQRVLSYLLDQCQIFANPISTDNSIMVKAASQRAIGLSIIGDMLLDAESSQEASSPAPGPLDDIVSV